MDKKVERNTSAKRLIASKPIFVLAIVLFVLVIFSVWFSGFSYHRSIFKNAVITISVISTICFLFFSTALFNGWKLKGNVGKITHKFKWGRLSDLGNWGFDGAGGGGGGHSHGFLEGVFETIGAIIIGIIAILFLIFLLRLFGNLIWAFILFAAGALYWIFFRAIRFVLRHGAKCRGNFWRSLYYGLGYTFLYSFTFYLLILIPYFMNRY